MTIEQLEAEIKRIGSLQATAQLQYEQGSCLTDKAQADGYALRMQALLVERETAQASE